MVCGFVLHIMNIRLRAVPVRKHTYVTLPVIRVTVIHRKGLGGGGIAKGVFVL